METMEKVTVEGRVAQDVAQFNPVEAKLAHYREYLTYRINGIADRDGALMVSKARKEVKAERVGLEKLRKAFVDDAVKYQRGVNAAAKAIADQLEEVETHLEAEEAKIAEEKERLARAEQEAIAAKLAARRERLFALGMNFNGQGYAGHGELIGEISVVSLTDVEFAAVVAKCEALKKAEEERQAQAAAAAKAEADRLAAERKAIEEERAAIEAERQRQEAEARRVQEEQEARERKIREEAEAVERAKREAIEAEDRKVREAKEAEERAERERVEAARREEERVATEARIAKEREEAAAAERLRIEAENKARAEREEVERIERESKMTDRAKLKAYCAALMAVPVPEMKSKAGAEKVAAIASKLEEITTL